MVVIDVEPVRGKLEEHLSRILPKLVDPVFEEAQLLKYVITLLERDVYETMDDLAQSMEEKLEDFLGDNTKPFVRSLFIWLNQNLPTATAAAAPPPPTSHEEYSPTAPRFDNDDYDAHEYPNRAAPADIASAASASHHHHHHHQQQQPYGGGGGDSRHHRDHRDRHHSSSSSSSHRHERHHRDRSPHRSGSRDRHHRHRERSRERSPHRSSRERHNGDGYRGGGRHDEYRGGGGGGGHRGGRGGRGGDYDQQHQRQYQEQQPQRHGGKRDRGADGTMVDDDDGGGGGGGPPTKRALPSGLTKRDLSAIRGQAPLDDEQVTLIVLRVPPEHNNEQSMREAFGKFGPVVAVRALERKNVCFVQFEHREHAIAALDSPEPLFNNRHISTMWARSTDENIAERRVKRQQLFHGNQQQQPGQVLSPHGGGGGYNNFGRGGGFGGRGRGGHGGDGYNEPYRRPPLPTGPMSVVFNNDDDDDGNDDNNNNNNENNDDGDDTKQQQQQQSNDPSNDNHDDNGRTSPAAAAVSSAAPPVSPSVNRALNVVQMRQALLSKQITLQKKMLSQLEDKSLTPAARQDLVSKLKDLETDVKATMSKQRQQAVQLKAAATAVVAAAAATIPAPSSSSAATATTSGVGATRATSSHGTDEDDGDRLRDIGDDDEEDDDDEDNRR